MAVTHTGGEFPHATLALVLYQAQEVEGLRAWTSDIARDMADKSYIRRGISLSLTETGLVARPDAFGLSGQVWVQAKLTDHWANTNSGEPYVSVDLDCIYGRDYNNRVSDGILVTRERLATQLESQVLKLLQEQGKYQLTRIGMLP